MSVSGVGGVGIGIGAWELHRSSRTGTDYYYHVPTKTSLWRDPDLPHGWAWSRTSETAPKLYTNLLTGATQSSIPTIAPIDREEESDSRRSGVKRARIDSGGTIAPTATSISSTALISPTIILTPGILDSTHPLPRLPTLMDEITGAPIPGLGMGFCDEAPPCLSRVEAAVTALSIRTTSTTTASGSNSSSSDHRVVSRGGTFFGDEHLLILQQLVRAAVSRHTLEGIAMMKALETRGRDAAEAAAEAAARTLVLIDIGAGAGVSTAAMLDCGGSSAQIFSIDLWDLSKDYYASQLQSFNHSALAAAWSKGDTGSDAPVSAPARAADCDTLFSLFCARFWGERDRLVPVRAHAPSGVAAVDRLGLAPALVWLDGDITAAGVRATLEAVWSRWLDPVVRAQGGTVGGGPPRMAPFVGGGGWDLSESVRTAVSVFAATHALPLHVEMGRAWTLSPEVVKETRNDPRAAPSGAAVGGAEAAAAGAALRVVEPSGERDAILRVWQAGVIRALDAPGEDVVRLTRALNDGGDGDDGKPSSTFLDAGCNDKRHLTLLMHATKAGKTKLVAALLTAGAGVNIQAARSAQTALHLAAYDGYTSAAAILLGAGADPDLVNKWGETPRGLASSRRHADVAELIAKAKPQAQ